MELMAIYVACGLDPSLAKQVADQLMVHDAIGAHVRDELCIRSVFESRSARPAPESRAWCSAKHSWSHWLTLHWARLAHSR